MTSTWVEHPDLVEYYSSHRNRPEDLYPSERRFLPWLARTSSEVVDVGCGAGGFATIWRSFNTQLRYIGVEASGALVDVASKLHPGDEFLQADGADRLPLPDAHADVVAALGWLHLEPRYRRALPELWRVARGRLFFDVRLHDRHERDVVGRQRLALAGEWDGETTIPYIATAWEAFARELLALGPARILAHGYGGSPAATVGGVDAPICFATFVVERGAGPATTPTVALDLPLPWPRGLTEVELLPAGSLDRLVGPEPR